MLLPYKQTQGRSTLAGVGPLLAGLLGLLGLLAGCQTLGPQPLTAAQAATLADWRSPARPVWRAPHLQVVAVAVNDFTYQEPLAGWETSAELLAQAAQVWLGVPPERVTVLQHPTHDDLQRFLTQTLPARLAPDDQVLFYLGTHQMKDGRLLLGQQTLTNAPELATWLAAIPGPTLLLADVCYGAAMEDRARFPGTVQRLYASLADEPTPELWVGGRMPSVDRYFAVTLALARAELGHPVTRISQTGMLALDTLRRQMQTGAGPLRADTWLADLAASHQAFRRYMNSLRRPTALLVNPQPWELAQANHYRPPGSWVAPAPSVASAVRDTHSAAWVCAGEPEAAPPAVAGNTTNPDSLDHFAPALQPVVTELLALLAPEAPPPDLAKGCFLIAKLHRPRADDSASVQALDQLVAKVRERLGAERDPEKAIAIINAILYQDMGLQARDQPFAEDYLLPVLLQDKVGRCAALSSLWLTLGQRLNLPLVGVCVPEHIFVRWETPAQGAQPAPARNIETTMGGKALEDAVYQQQRPWGDSERAAAFYGRPLTARQALATYLSPLCSSLRDQGRVAEAIVIGRRAVALLPHDPEAWNNLGMCYRLNGQEPLALLAYQQALRILPTFAEVWNNLGNLAQEPATRIEHFRRAIQLRPSLGEAWRNLALAQYDAGRYAAARDSAAQAAERGAPLAPHYLKAIERRAGEQAAPPGDH
jgi:regulator of sirC expression with transglutaminase-like and TPR domain